MSQQKPRSVILSTQLNLARIAGVNKQLVQYQCSKGDLREAMVGPTAKRKPDINHPAVHAWLESHGVDPASVPEIAAAAARDGDRMGDPAALPTAGAQRRDRVIHGPRDIEEILDWTFRRITDEFQSLEGFANWMTLRRQAADTKRLELANSEKSGRLIDREYVATHVFGALDATQRRMITDAARTLTHRTYAMAAAGKPVEEALRANQEILSSHLKPLKATAARQLRDKKK